MTAANPTPQAYQSLRQAQSTWWPLRGLRYHAHTWGDAASVSPERPPLVLLHGWMDVGASFQFVVDELARAEGFERFVIAPDWRGFGRTETPGADSYWFPDYLGDLDALLDALLGPFTPTGGDAAVEVTTGASRSHHGVQAVDLLGHSMGGNVVMSYAGVRPERVRRLINLEGFGLPQTRPTLAPRRLQQWLNELQQPQSLRDYASVEEVAQRLMKNNPRLRPDMAAWLAPHWARRGADGRWHIQGDPAHKRSNPVLYRVEEILETWKLITAPLLWVEGAQTDLSPWWGTRYSKAEFHERLNQVPQAQRECLADCAHMLHHDQPEALAQHLARFLA